VSSAGNPITATIVVAPGETVLVVMLVTTGSTNRAGAAPTYGSQTFLQADTVQKAATSPEASAELWYLIDPVVGSATLTIPNTGAATIRYVVVAGRAPAGGGSEFLIAGGANNTSTNPTVSLQLGAPGVIWFSVVASGAQTWAPSARNGTQISDTDDGANGDGFQYGLVAAPALQAMGWTFGTSDDWGVVAAAFCEKPAQALNNYMGFKAGDGMSVAEKIR